MGNIKCIGDRGHRAAIPEHFGRFSKLHSQQSKTRRWGWFHLAINTYIRASQRTETDTFGSDDSFPSNTSLPPWDRKRSRRLAEDVCIAGALQKVFWSQERWIPRIRAKLLERLVPDLQLVQGKQEGFISIPSLEQPTKLSGQVLNKDAIPRQCDAPELRFLLCQQIEAGLAQTSWQYWALFRSVIKNPGERKREKKPTWLLPFHGRCQLSHVAVVLQHPGPNHERCWALWTPFRLSA